MITIEAMKDCSYNEHQKLIKKSIVIPLALLLLFWSSNYVAVGRALYRGFLDVLNKPLLIFIFMNFIIVTLCFQPTPKQIEPTYHVGCHHHEIDDGPIHGNPDVVDSDLSDDDKQTEEENILVDKHIILVENAVGERNHHHHAFELQRLERRMSKELIIKMREPPWRSSMDKMSNEEFRFAVDAFISQRNRVMIQESKHDEEMMHFLISASN